jgi:hypothetical protein
MGVHQTAADRNAPLIRPAHTQTIIGLRLMLIGLGAALGLALLSQGFVVIGALVLTMSVLRAVLALRWGHRVEAPARRAFRGTVDARRALGSRRGHRRM